MRPVVGAAMLMTFLAGCGPSPRRVDDAGRGPPPLRSDLGPALPAGPHLCGRVRDVVQGEPLADTPIGDPGFAVEWPWLAGAFAGSDAVFAFATADGTGTSGLVVPSRGSGATVPLLTSDEPGWGLRPGFAMMGNAAVLVSIGRGAREIVMVDPRRAEVRTRRTFPAAVLALDPVALAAGEGVVIAAYHPPDGPPAIHIARLGPTFELEGEPDVVPAYGASPELTRTDRGFLVVWGGACVTTTLPLDATGRPTDTPLCTDDVIGPEQARTPVVWDGTRVVMLRGSRVLELDAEGRLASATEVLDGVLLAAFGTDEGLAILVALYALGVRAELRVVVRETAEVLRSWPVVDGPGRIAPNAAAVALRESAAELLVHGSLSSAFDRAVVTCD